MFLAGIASLFQEIFLPGLLVLRLLKYKTNSLIQKVVYVFGISLLVNYILVFLLTLLQIYTYHTLLAILFIELVLLIGPPKRIKISVSLSFINFQKNINGIFSFALILISLFLIGHFFALVVLNLNPKSVFITGDAIDSWNKWAVAWSNNTIPINSFHYSQLIPANWSMGYVLMRTSEVQLFAKAIMPLFSLFILLIFWDLAVKSKKIYYLVGLIIVGYLIKYFFDSTFIRDGYVDMALAFFSFLTFYAILNTGKKYGSKDLILIILFAFASFFTKQSGISIILFVGVWLYTKLKKKRIKLSAIQTPKIYFVVISLLFISIEWILPRVPEIVNYKMYNIEGIMRVASSGEGAYLERFVFGVRSLFNGTKSIIFLSVVLALYLISLKDKRSKVISIYFIFPLFIFWGFFLSYDRRNLSLLFPFFAYVDGVGFDYISKRILFIGSHGKWLSNKQLFNSSLHGSAIIRSWDMGRIYRLGWISAIDDVYRKNIRVLARRSFNIKINSIILLASLLLAAVFISGLVSDKYLLRSQEKGKKEIGIPTLNTKLYSYFGRDKINGKILTNYFRLTNLPKLQKYAHYKLGVISREDIVGIDISYILFFEGRLDSSAISVIRSSAYENIFQYGAWHLVKKI